MKHEQAAPLVADWIEGDLAEGSRHGVASHVQGCANCQELATAYRLLAAAIRSEGQPQHPSEESLVGWVVDRSALAAREKDEIAAHLQVCGACDRIVCALEAAERETGAKVLSFSRRRPVFRAPGWRAAAAILVAAAGVYAGYVGGVRSRPETPDARSWAGAAELPLVTSALRDERQAVTRIHVDPARPVVPIAVAPVLPAAAGPETMYILAIRDSTGGAVWTIELDAARVRELIEASGALILLVPAEAVPPGRYELTVAPSAPDAGALIRAPIEIVAGAEDGAN